MQFVADFGRLSSLYETGAHAPMVSRLRQELAQVKDQRDEADKRILLSAEREKVATSEVAALLELKSSWESEKKTFGALLELRDEEILGLKEAVTRMETEHEAAMAQADEAKNSVILNLERVEAELVKSQEEAVRSLEEGYKICWDGAVAAGLEMENLTFDKYCESLAVGGDGDGAGSSTAAGDGGGAGAP